VVSDGNISALPSLVSGISHTPVSPSLSAEKGILNVCSGLMIPDTNIVGKIAAVREVLNEKTAAIFFYRI